MTVYQKQDGVKRPYRSPRRVAQAKATRAAIIEAAAKLFVESGYAQTSVREIAQAADVAEPTIYATLGDKASIAREVGQAMADKVGQSVLSGLEEELSAEPRLAARARMIAKVNHLAYWSDAMQLRDALIVGAASDPRLEEIVAELSRGGRQTTAWLVDLLIGDRKMTQQARERALDIIWAISSSAIYRRLVEACGWSADEYEDWLALELRRAIRLASTSYPNRLPSSADT